MGFRYQKRVKILPGVWLCFSKSGVSLSLGPRGLKTSISKRGVRHSFGIPGTGMRYETRYRKPGERTKRSRRSSSSRSSGAYGGGRSGGSSLLGRFLHFLGLS